MPRLTLSPRADIALVKNNAAIGAEIAVSLAQLAQAPAAAGSAPAAAPLVAKL